jgi:SNF2 family DNA or RNA helicase
MSDALAPLPELPLYLTLPPESGPTYGRLCRAHDEAWELKDAEPQAALLAKRLFPGSSGRGAGEARFFASKRLFGDLVWFLQRWPMAIEDRPAFLKEYHEACSYVQHRMAFNDTPRLAMPGATFTGELRPFQQEGLAWALTNERTLIADDMGLGKTVQGLAWLSARGSWPALIVVPPHLLNHWEKMLPLFLKSEGEEEVKIHTIKGRKHYPLPDAHIYLIHYLLIDAWKQPLLGMDLRDILFDEIQELRHGGSLKYSAASALAAKAEGVLGLSGTPIYGYGGEIWNVLNIIEYHCLGDWDSFTREWGNGYGSVEVKHPEVLSAHLRREGLMIRRRKKDVLKELPDKRRVVVELDSDTSKFNQMIGKAVDLAMAASATKDQFERGRLEQAALTETRRVTGVAKAPAVADFVRTLMEAGEPTLLFVHHHMVTDILKEKLKEFNPRFISGRETRDEKKQALEDFQNGVTSLCIISLRAAAGLDGFQERARVVVFAELDWSPAVHSQAEDRAHRMGQHDSVLCYYLVSSVGTDLEMREALGLKIAQFMGVMGDEAEQPEDQVLAEQASKAHMRKVLARLTSKIKRQPAKQAEAA